MALSPRVDAQVSGYGFTPSSGAYTPITGGTQLNSTIPDSWVSGAITLSPAFNFGGTSYTTAYVTSNGLLTLGGSAPSNIEYNGIANTTGSGIAICPFNADMIASSVTGAAPEIRFETVGNEHVFQWKDIMRYQAGDKFSFQLRLNTSTGVVTMVYGGGITVGTSTSYQPIVGIRRSTTDYKNLKVTATGTETWAAPLIGTTTSDNLRFTSATPNPKFPTDGQTYTFTPITCFTPVNLAVSGATSTSINLTWSAPAGSTPVTYLWEVRTSGAPGSGTTGLAASGLTTAPTTSATANGLTLSTSYSAYVRATCGGTDSSAWSAATTFTLQLPCVAPANQPTALLLTPASTSVGGAFTAASPAADRYLVVRTTGAAPTAPVNGTTYSAGAGLGGTIVTNLTTPTVTFNNTGLTGNTSYAYYVYSYSSVNCSGGPTYNTANPLTATTITCPAVPASPTVSNTTSTGFTLGWTSSLGGGASPVTYTVDVTTDAAFANPVAGSPFTVADPTVSVNVTGLTASTQYYYRVRANGTCNSAYSASASVTTACNALATFPYVESFDAGVLPACWSTAVVSGTANWSVVTGTSTDISAPKAGAGFIRKPYNTSTANLYSPAFNLSSFGTNQARINLWVYRHSGTVANDSIRFAVNTSTSFTGAANLMVIKPLTTQAPAVTASGWYNYTANIPASFNTATPVYILIQGVTTAGFSSYDLGLDSFRLEQVPPCLAPTPATVTNVATTSAVLSWTASASAPAGGYEYEVRTSGAPGSGPAGLVTSGTTAASVVTTPVSGLMANTAYSVYVRANCGSTLGNSLWTTATTFTTLCNPVTVFPFLETFESNSTTKSCWKVVNGNNDADQWNLSSTTVAGHTGTMEASLYTDGNGGNNSDWLISPALTLGTNKQLRYWYRVQSASEPNDYTVKISTTGNDTTNFTTTLMPLTSVNNTTWVENTINLSAYTGTVYVAFHVPAGGLDGWYLHIDDVNFETIPTCFPPTGLAVTGTNPTGTTLNWVAPTAGTPVSYKWEVRTSGAPGSGATGLAATATVNAPLTTATVTGLTPNTAYSVYVQSNCGGGDTSFWTSAVVTFATPCLPSTLPFTENFATVPPACWSTGQGYLTATPTALTPAGTSWGLDQYLNNSANGPAARINLFTTGKRDWLISPTIDLGTTAGDYVLEFNLGIVVYSFGTSVTNPTGVTLGSDDTVAVVISTNNGATWSSANALRTWTAANTPINATGNQRYYIPMNGYSGQIKIGFYGSEGSVDDAPDNDIFIDSVRMTTCTKPVVALGNDTAICPGSSLTLSAGAAASYTWSTLATTQSINVTTPGTYSVTAFTANPGCFRADTIVVTNAPVPVVNLGNDTAICSGASLTLNAGNAGGTYLWSNNATTQTTTVNTAGTYSVRVTNAQGCIGRDTIIVTTTPNPVVALGNDTAICAGATLTLNAGNPGASYLYSTNATTQTIGVTTAGTYNVRVTNAQGCIGRDTIVVAVTANPVVALGNDTAFCAGSSITLNAGNPGASYLYSTQATTQTIQVSTAGTYSVRVTNAQGCIGRDTIVVAINANPTVNLGNDTAICAGATLTLNAGNPGAAYLYSTNATTQTIPVTTAGTYNVRVTSPQGCIGRDTIVVSVNPLPVVNLGPDVSICTGSSVTLNAGNAGASYLWSTQATTQTIAVTTGGQYSVRVTNASGCIGRDTVNVTVNPLPVVNLGNDTTVCGNVASFVLNAGNLGSTYVWTPSQGVTTQTYNVAPIINSANQLGGGLGQFSLLFYVDVTNANGCTKRDSILITPTFTARVSGITTSGVDPVVSFAPQGDSFATAYNWNFGDGSGTSTQQTPTYQYAANGTYTVTLIVSNQCGSDTVTTTVTISGLGVRDVITAGDLKLFPNPATTTATIEVADGLKLRGVQVMSATGAVVMSVPLDGTRANLNTSALANGIYTLRIQLDKGVVVRKLEVVR